MDDDELWVCTFNGSAMLRYRITDDGVAERSGTVTDDCQLDVTILTDGRVAYSTGDAINIIDPT